MQFVTVKLKICMHHANLVPAELGAGCCHRRFDVILCFMTSMFANELCQCSPWLVHRDLQGGERVSALDFVMLQTSLKSLLAPFNCCPTWNTELTLLFYVSF